jgi:hypothetical protein
MKVQYLIFSNVLIISLPYVSCTDNLEVHEGDCSNLKLTMVPLVKSFGFLCFIFPS